ncbi:GNAT family N-acetyltransferase [Aureimonas flava]|uniref:GNAT family N-acetyltransferase n=1 Tax=Aureimonas flava TaxID=2320271 RepID=A0A3A1WIW0_9HYPH|nr:GNAT family N-acetyltransferase [Aureimonas flava]RIX98423.1 GNAT family N-acetyltransferase [Aureimonas flava]
MANLTLGKVDERDGERAIAATARRVVEAPSLDGFASLAPAGDVRRVSIYDAHAVFGLVDELEHLGARALEPNVFFTPRFLAPAMPRLDDRRVRLMVARDEDDRRSRLRFLMPFTVERLQRPSRRGAVRAWTHPFGPLGVLPLDRDDPAGTARSLLDALRAPEHALPPLLVLPDLPVGGELARCLAEAAQEANMPFAWADRSARAFLDADGHEPAEVLRQALGPAGFRDHRRRLRQLADLGEVAFECAAEPGAVREALEDFLHLEASGWKGRRRSALLIDRHRAAFAREAVNGLAERGMARVYTLRVAGAAAASLVVLHAQGHAAAWKTAYDERLRRYGPGALVAALATQALVADPAIHTADSCTVPDHGVMNRLWRGRIAVGTLVVGLDDPRGEQVADAVAAIEGARRRLNRRRIWRERLRHLWPARG